MQYAAFLSSNGEAMMSWHRAFDEKTPRGSGRTCHQLGLAVEVALQGFNVVFLCMSSSYQHAADLLGKMLEKAEVEFVQKGRDDFFIRGRFRIRIARYASDSVHRLRGLRRSVIMFDHCFATPVNREDERAIADLFDLAAINNFPHVKTLKERMNDL